MKAAVLAVALVAASSLGLAAEGRVAASAAPAAHVVPIAPASVRVIPSLSPQPGGNRAFTWPDRDKIVLAILTAIFGGLVALFVAYFQKIMDAAYRALGPLAEGLLSGHAAETTYRTRIAQDLRSLQILVMSEARDLQTLYIPLRLADWAHPDVREIVRDQSSPTMSLAEALERFNLIVVVGDPGSGKTTVTSHAAALAADGTLLQGRRPYFPVYVHLRDLKEFLTDPASERRVQSLVTLLSKILALQKIKNPDHVLDRKLERGACLIVLDGFDELADKDGVLQRRFSHAVQTFANTMPAGNKIVLTSRSAGYEPAWFPRFRVFEMMDLDLPQMHTFVNGWFGSDLDGQGARLCQIVAGSERLQLLGANPLMLAIVCFVYEARKRDEQFLPRRRVALYEQCVEALTVEWDRSRGINRGTRFTASQIESVLRNVAYHALRQNEVDFSRTQLLAVVRANLAQVGLGGRHAEAMLEEILSHTGIVKKKTRNTYGFIHLTFLEYLAAHVIASQVDRGIASKNLEENIADVVSNLANPRWAEPIALAAGILRGRSDFVSLIYDRYTQTPQSELRLLLGACLRDADLLDASLDPQYCVKQDEILSELVSMAMNAEGSLV